MVRVTEIEILEKRNTSYQFDIEQDIPWTDISRPGMYLGPSLLEKLGFNTALLLHDPEAMEVCQWVMGLALAEEFVNLEREVIKFIEQTENLIEPTRSSALLVEEERKHIALFERFCAKLRKDRPDLVSLFDAAHQPSVVFSVIEKQRNRIEPEEFQWLCWITTLFFEEYTLFIARSLEEDKDLIQPVWLTANQCHRREEAQHILTDSAYMESLPISTEKRRQLAATFICAIENNVTTYFSLSTWLRIQDALFPNKEYLSNRLKLKSLPLYQDIQRNPVFRFTRKYLPALVRHTENSLSNSTENLALRGCTRSRLRSEQNSNLLEKLEYAADGGREIIYTSTRGTNARITYEELFIKSEEYLAALQESGLRPKEAVVLWLRDPDEMVPVFWACILGGLLPVVLSPSIFVDQYSEEINQLRRVLTKVNCRVVVTDNPVKSTLSDVLCAAGDQTTQVMSVLELEKYSSGSASIKRPSTVDPAMVQFSSGSMRSPRGVILTHRNLIAVINAMLSARDVMADDVFVSWLPLSHDMGLIGFHLTPLVIGARQVLISPREFMKRPKIWLQALNDFKANLTGGTNSAIERTLANTKPEFIEQLDLSCVHSLIVGAEPISPRLMKQMMRTFKPAGLKPHAVCPAYGLAEASLAVTMMPRDSSPYTGQFSRRKLAEGMVISAQNSKDLVEFTNLGVPVSGVRLRIVDDTHHILEENMVGKIEVSGDSVTRGYIEDEEATREVLNNGWLDTGDRGFMRKGQLYFVGRDDETFFVRGRKYYARDIESIAAEVQSQDSDTGVLAIENDEIGPRNRLILFIPERHKVDGEVRQALDEIQQHVQRRLGISLDEIVSIYRKDVPRTRSGKIARHLLLQRYRDGLINGMRCMYESKAAFHNESIKNKEAGYGFSGGSPRIEFFKNIESSIRNIWADVLSRPYAEIGINEDFRRLGGDSLAAATILVRLENESGLYYPTELLMHGTTVKKMSSFVRNYIDQQYNADIRTGAAYSGERKLCEVNNVSIHQGNRYCPDITCLEDEGEHVGSWTEARNDTPGINHHESKRKGNYFTNSSACDTEKTADLKIAVVGMGIRFPSASTPEDFWKMLWEGRDAFRVIPDERRHGPLWRESIPGVAHIQEMGAFLDDVERFDPVPFGITGEEARYLDPQQRVFLEVCSDALDCASIEDREVGVFAASGDNEYGFRYLGSPDKVSRYTLLGGLRNMVAARVSQVFGFSGPALTVDTACSASATAIHLACESLRRGECTTALAGGVQLNLSNQLYTYFSSAGLLSMKGECRPFDIDATGLVPGEGAAAVLLKPLEQSIADGDEIIAVISSSAMNNDAGTLSGTAPGSTGQRKVIQAAYKYASIDPATVSYIEAHAAGTAVGDAVEIQSITEALGELPAEIPIGSVKSNIGHLFAAAGIASLIKVILMLQYKQIPSTLGCRRPTKRISIEKTSIFPVVEKKEWKVKGSTLRRAGINSFGLGGTNVHLVVEEAPVSEKEAGVGKGVGIFCLNAAPTQAATVADNYLRYLRQSSSTIEEICAASMTRGQFFRQHNAAVIHSKDELNTYLQKITKTREAPSDPGLVGFVLPDGSSSIQEAARYLYTRETKFRSCWDECAAYFRDEGLDLTSSLEKSHIEKEPLTASQALVFAYGVSAVRWLESLWVCPDYVTGCDIGEYAAAHIAGLLSLKAAVQLVLQRSRYISSKQKMHMAGYCSFDSIKEQLQLEHDKGVQLSTITERNRRFISTIDGGIVRRTDASYWLRHLIASADLDSAIKCATNNGVRTFIDLGDSRKQSINLIRKTSTESVRTRFIPLVKATSTENIDVRESLASIIDAGIFVNLARSHYYKSVKRALLPAYPYQRKRHWIELEQEPNPVSNENILSLEHTAISDHRLSGTPTAPLALLADYVLWKRSASHNPDKELHRIVLAEGLSISADEQRKIEITKAIGGKQHEWVVRSYSLANNDKKDHMQCSVLPLKGRVFSTIDLDSIAMRCPVFVSKEAVYEVLERYGLSIGPAMQSVKSVQVGDGELIAQLEAPENATSGHFVDPSLFDGASHAIAAFAYQLAEQRPAPYAGISVDKLRIYNPIRGSAIAYVQLRNGTDLTSDVIRYDIILATEHGEVLLLAEDFAAKRIKISKRPTASEKCYLGSHLNDNKSFDDNTHLLNMEQKTAVVECEEIKRTKHRDTDMRDLTRVVQRIIAKYLGISTNRLSPRVQFSELGVDSIMAVDIATALERELGISLNATLLFEANTLVELGRILEDKIDHDS